MRAIVNGSDISDSASQPLERTGVLVEDGRPVETLVASAANADLLVVGSRSLQDVRAHGRVGERVAQKVPCSLVVGPPTRP